MSTTIFRYLHFCAILKIEMNCGPRLKQLRNEKGWKQEQLAEQSGASRKHISAIESGVADPTVGMLEALAGTLGFSLPQFFEGKIPEEYSDPLQRDLHEKLQAILERGGERAIGIKVNIEDLYRAALDDSTLPEESKELPRGTVTKSRRRFRRTG